MSENTPIPLRLRFTALRRFHVHHGPTDVVAIFFNPQADRVEGATSAARSHETGNPAKSAEAPSRDARRHDPAIDVGADSRHSEPRSAGGSGERPGLEDKGELKRPSLVDRTIRPLIDGRRCHSQGACQRGCVPAVRGNGLCFRNGWRRHAAYISTLIHCMQARYHGMTISWLTCL